MFHRESRSVHRLQFSNICVSEARRVVLRNPNPMFVHSNSLTGARNFTGFALHGVVLHGIAWYNMVLHRKAQYCMVLHGIAWYCMLLRDSAWY